MILLDRNADAWYRHSGEDPIKEIPEASNCIFIAWEDIEGTLENLGGDHITHLYLRYGKLPELAKIVPKLTHLKLDGVEIPQTGYYSIH